MGKKLKLLSAQERTPIEESGNLKIVDELYGYTVRPGGSARRRAMNFMDIPCDRAAAPAAARR